MKRRRLKPIKNKLGLQELYTPHQVAVLRILRASPTKLTASEIAHYSCMDWKTAEKVLKDFHKKGRVKKKEKGNRTYWWIPR